MATRNQSDHTPEPVWDRRLHQAVNDDIYVPEVFKTLRSRLLHPKEGAVAPKTVLVTSVIPEEGKSFVTLNLGISLAQGMDQYALLADCDLRRPALAAMLGMEEEPGLADYLAGAKNLEELICRTSVPKLSLLPSGRPPKNPAELLSSSRMQRLVEELAGRYDDRIIIFDTPPARIASEVVVLAKQVDGIILVVREGGAGREDIRRVVEVIGPERVIGVVFNARTDSILEKSYYHGAASYYHRRPRR